MELGNSRDWLQLATGFQELGQYEDALAALTQAAPLDPYSAEIQHRMGVCFLLLRRDREAAAAFRTVLRLDSGHTGARLNLATLLGREAPTEAARHLKVLWRQDPNMAALLEGNLRHPGGS